MDENEAASLIERTEETDKAQQLRKRFKKPIPKPVEFDPEYAAKGLTFANKIREERQKAIAAANARGKSAPTEEMHYVECYFCHGPGIWIHKNHDATLGNDDWEASYKPRGVYWSPQELPHCQCCEADGHKIMLRMFFATDGSHPGAERTGIMCNPRWVRGISKNDFKELVGEA